jgi:hypothetical protein
MDNENSISSEKMTDSKASVLIQPRPRAPSTRLLYSDNINADVKGKSSIP